MIEKKVSSEKLIRYRNFWLPKTTLLLSACGSTEFKAGAPNSERVADHSESSDDLGRRRISSQEYLEKFYSQQKPVVGIANLKNNEVPVVSPISVANSDIVFQIFRCDSAQTIEGRVEVFDDDHPSLSSPDLAKAYFSRNQFWQDVQIKCVKTANSQAQLEFIDSSAPSGNLRWLMRACLMGDHADQPVCSDVIFASDVLTGYRNRFSERQKLLLERVNKKMLSISGISSSFPERARRLALALENCGQTEWNKASRQIIRSLLLNLVGMGSSIVFEVFGPTETSKKSWAEKIQTIWQPTTDVQKNGQAVTRILSWLFTNRHDFKETCTEAEEIRVTAESEILRLQSLQVSLASDLDDAARLDLPLPKEVQP